MNIMLKKMQELNKMQAQLIGNQNNFKTNN